MTEETKTLVDVEFINLIKTNVYSIKYLENKSMENVAKRNAYSYINLKNQEIDLSLSRWQAIFIQSPDFLVKKIEGAKRSIGEAIFCSTTNESGDLKESWYEIGILYDSILRSYSLLSKDFDEWKEEFISEKIRELEIISSVKNSLKRSYTQRSGRKSAPLNYYDVLEIDDIVYSENKNLHIVESMSLGEAILCMKTNELGNGELKADLKDWVAVQRGERMSIFNFTFSDFEIFRCNYLKKLM